MAEIDKYLNKITQGDSREILKEFPDKSVDIILTDPPYGVSFKKKNDPYMIGDHINPLPWLYAELYRVLKDDGAIFVFSSMSYFVETMLPFQTYFKLHNTIIWKKNRPIYPHSKAHFCLQYEPILYGSKGLFYLNKKKASDVIEGEIPAGKIRIHPTQKPLDLIEQIIKSTPETKQIILDPFCGSGTMCLAAKRLARQYIGIEISPIYVEMAENRLKSLW